jgi:hypothetical protein
MPETMLLVSPVNISVRASLAPVATIGEAASPTR